MNVDLADKLYELLKHKKLDEAIALAEQELQGIPPTGFHKILGKNLLHQTSALAIYIKAFDKSTKAVLKKDHGFLRNLFSFGRGPVPAAYYCEMNGFTINYDRWFIELFSYENYGSIDWEWLSEFYDSSVDDFTITGLEDIQSVFQDVHENNRLDEPEISKAYEVCELLVILRLQELFREVYRTHKADWNTIPMFVTAHDYELIYKVN